MHFKKPATVTLLLALICLTLVATTLAQPQTVYPGVSKGNTFTYDVEGMWSSDDPNATMSDQIQQLNMTDYFKVEITAVSGPEVTMNTIWRFTNGTELDGETKMDVSTGMYSGSSYFWAIFAGNLNDGDRIHPTGPDQIRVNGTQTKDYANKQREINRLVLIAQFESTDNSSRTYNDYRTVFFDKQTGMLVELYNEQRYTNPAYTETIIWELTDTNAFTASGFPVTTLVVVVAVSIIIAILLAVIVFKKRGKKRKRRI